MQPQPITSAVREVPDSFMMAMKLPPATKVQGWRRHFGRVLADVVDGIRHKPSPASRGFRQRPALGWLGRSHGRRPLM